MEREYTAFFPFGGGGFGARGFQKAAIRLGLHGARIRVLGGFDIWDLACQQFKALTGVQQACLDVFSAEQFRLYHAECKAQPDAKRKPKKCHRCGNTGEPLAGWREVTPADMLAACGGEYPDILFGSAPCKGATGMISDAAAGRPRYVALNQLTERALWLCLEAFAAKLPRVILFENVPGLMRRGKAMLARVKKLLQHYGYAVHEATHDCGDIGHLAQRRERYLLIARHVETTGHFIYEPPSRGHLTVGDVLARTPLPNDPAAGPMHQLPHLSLLTWLRLALIPEGKDWRALKDLKVEDGNLKDYALLPEREWQDSVLGVRGWDETVGAIKTRSEPAQGAYSVAEPRIGEGYHHGVLGVRDPGEPVGAISGSAQPNTGAYSLADPRTGELQNTALGVRDPGDPVGAIKGESLPTNGAYSLSDPRTGPLGDYQAYGVKEWEGTASAVTGQSAPGGGANTIADPRIEAYGQHDNKLLVQSADKAAKAVTTETRVGSGAAVWAQPFPDPAGRWREGELSHNNVCRVVGDDDACVAVTAGGSPTSGAPSRAQAIPDLSSGWMGGNRGHANLYRVVSLAEKAPLVTAATRPAGGAASVSQPIPDVGAPWIAKGGSYHNVFRVIGDDETSPTITTQTRPVAGSPSVAIPARTTDSGWMEGGQRKNFQGGGHLGVLSWDGTSGAVTGAMSVDNGRAAVSSPRWSGPLSPAPLWTDLNAQPEDPPVILTWCAKHARWEWHRPFTTAELAIFQGYDPFGEDGPMVTNVHTHARAMIGNAVPISAAEAVGEVICRALLKVDTDTVQWEGGDIWVDADRRGTRQILIALSIPEAEIPHV